MRFKIMSLFLMILFVTFFAGITPAAEDPGDLKVDVQEFTLENGMLFLVVERHETPQVASRLAIRAGSALEQAGKTGTAHMLEHMMFKGTNTLGTRDWQKDLELQEKIEAAYQAVLEEQRKREPNQDLIRAKTEEMHRLRREVQKIFVAQAFSSRSRLIRSRDAFQSS